MVLACLELLADLANTLAYRANLDTRRPPILGVFAGGVTAVVGGQGRLNLATQIKDDPIAMEGIFNGRSRV